MNLDSTETCTITILYMPLEYPQEDSLSLNLPIFISFVEFPWCQGASTSPPQKHFNPKAHLICISVDTQLLKSIGSQHQL